LNTKYIQEYFQIFSRFYNIENLISLIDGRPFDIIYAFYKTFKNIFFNDISQVEKNLKYLQQIINIYENDIYKNYKIKSTKCKFKNISQTNLIFFTKNINSNKQHIINFFEANEFLYAYTNRQKFDTILTEFYNSISHTLLSLQNKNRKDNFTKSIFHIYRATLDIYKYIITSETDFILKNKFLLFKLKNIRTIESCKIGLNHRLINHQNSLVKTYYKFCWEILN
jgi:hypothetical protein